MSLDTETHTHGAPSCVLLLFYVPSALSLPAVPLQSNYRSALRLQAGDKKVNDQQGAGRTQRGQGRGGYTGLMNEWVSIGFWRKRFHSEETKSKCFETKLYFCDCGEICRNCFLFCLRLTPSEFHSIKYSERSVEVIRNNGEKLK